MKPNLPAHWFITGSYMQKRCPKTCSHATAFSRGHSWHLSTYWNSVSQVGEEAHGVKLSLQRLQGTWGTWVSCQPNDRVVQSSTASQGACLCGTHFPARRHCSTAVLSCCGLCWDPPSSLLWHLSQLFNPGDVSSLQKSKALDTDNT